MAKELIIIIPGLARVIRSVQLEYFVAGLIATSENVFLKRANDDDVPVVASRISGDRSSTPFSFDVAETYWNDLVPTLTQENPHTELIRGNKPLRLLALLHCLV